MDIFEYAEHLYFLLLSWIGLILLGSFPILLLLNFFDLKESRPMWFWLFLIFLGVVVAYVGGLTLIGISLFEIAYNYIFL